MATDAGPASGGTHDLAPVAAEPFDGVALDDSRKRLAGWSADRQRLFLSTLAETGSVHLASNAARLSARGAYRLRTRSPAFAAAWDTALQLSVGRLSAIVFDRAINGRVEQIYREGNLVAERRVPSDKLLTWLLARLDPKRFALPWEQRGDADPQADAVAAFPALLNSVRDVEVLIGPVTANIRNIRVAAQHQLRALLPASRTSPLPTIAAATSRPLTSTLCTSRPDRSCAGALTVTLPLLSRSASSTAASIPRSRSAAQPASWIRGAAMPAISTFAPATWMVSPSLTQLAAPV